MENTNTTNLGNTLVNSKYYKEESIRDEICNEEFYNFFNNVFRYTLNG